MGESCCGTPVLGWLQFAGEQDTSTPCPAFSSSRHAFQPQLHHQAGDSLPGHALAVAENQFSVDARSTVDPIRAFMGRLDELEAFIFGYTSGGRAILPGVVSRGPGLL